MFSGEPSIILIRYVLFSKYYIVFNGAPRGIKTMPLDLLAFNQDDFYSYVDCPASFQHEIAMNGVLLYEHK